MINDTIFLSISEVIIKVNVGEQLLKITDSFKPFIVDKQKCLYQVKTQSIEKLTYTGIEVFSNQDYKVYEDHNEFYQVYHDHKNNDRPYAIVKHDFDKKIVNIFYLPDAHGFLSETGNCFFHIGWEKILIHENRIMLHSSCLHTQLGGILFSGPSGIGKSTQADLWMKYENAQMINGDRTILTKIDGQWRGYGSPYAGSSRCYVNDYTCIRAIIMLNQASVCSIRKLDEAEAFRKVYAGLTVNSWNPDFVMKVCDLATELIHDIPVYELNCTPDKRTVDLLKETLLKEENNGLEKCKS